MTRRNRAFLLVGLLVALVLAGFVSYYASDSPHGFEKVAAQHGITATVHNHHDHDHDQDHDGGSPLAGYSTKGVDNERLSGAVAGSAGVALTFGAATGVFWVVKRNRPGNDGEFGTDAAGRPGRVSRGHAHRPFHPKREPGAPAARRSASCRWRLPRSPRRRSPIAAASESRVSTRDAGRETPCWTTLVSLSRPHGQRRTSTAGRLPRRQSSGLSRFVSTLGIASISGGVTAQAASI